MLKCLSIELDIIFTGSVTVRDLVNLLKNIHLVDFNVQLDIQSWDDLALVSGFQGSHEMLEDGADALDDAVLDDSISVVLFQLTLEDSENLSEIWSLQYLLWKVYQKRSDTLIRRRDNFEVSGF